MFCKCHREHKLCKFLYLKDRSTFPSFSLLLWLIYKYDCISLLCSFNCTHYCGKCFRLTNYKTPVRTPSPQRLALRHPLWGCRCCLEQPRALHLHQGEKQHRNFGQHNDHVCRKDNLHYSVNWDDHCRMDTAHRLVRSVLMYWRVLCFMKDENLLSMFGIGRDMVDKQVKLKIMLLVIV